MIALDAARSVLERAVADGVTPGAQLSVHHEGRDAHLAVGALDYAQASPAVTVDTVYDLASLTKLFTAMALARIARRDGLDLGAPLASWLSWSARHPAGEATLLGLLTHRAGLVHWAPFYRAWGAEAAGSADTREGLLRAVASTPVGDAGSTRYSDLGYMLLGEALAARAGEAIADVVAREVTAPLGLDGRVRYRGVGAHWQTPAIAPTERCPWRGRVVQGEVHDENCYALGGTAGHAGLFGAARDVCALGAAALACLGGDARWTAPELLRWMIAPRPGGAHRVGWDARSDGAPSSGTRMGPRTFGHLGFTGTSLWCDPDRGVAIALVTNRVHPTRDNGAIRALRPAVHDAVMESLGR